MPLPDDAIALVSRFCDERSTDDSRIEYTTRGSAITIVERRPPWQPEAAEWTATDVAQLRHDDAAGTWSLWWRRASGRWTAYDDVTPVPGLGPLLAEIDADLDGVFWG